METLLLSIFLLASCIAAVAIGQVIAHLLDRSYDDLG